MTEAATNSAQKKDQPIKASEIDPKFKCELQKIHGSEKIPKCFQCGTCISDYPVARYCDKVALQLARDKLNHIKMVDAQALIKICAFCHIMYDTNDLRIEKTFNETYGIPILHYPQLLGIATGIIPEELAFNELRVSASKPLKQVTHGANI